jgi:hypothetical protein
VDSYFYPQLSCKKNINKNNLNLLQYAHLHWDLSELYARKLSAAYKKYIPQNDVKEELEFIFKRFEKNVSKVKILMIWKPRTVY